ncbi:MAG: SHOCT domain-containing protein [Candidatus Altiarchaeota archaeon]|nr:SHOCT domain-containing protein [Candidatus Altiarchaeota archaeon]
MNDSIVEHSGRVFSGMVGNGSRGFLKHTIFGIPTFMIWNLAIILLLALIFYWLVRGSKKSNESPLDLLKKRYVRGEIDEKTFEEMKEVIGD